MIEVRLIVGICRVLDRISAGTVALHHRATTQGTKVMDRMVSMLSRTPIGMIAALHAFSSFGSFGLVFISLHID
jgi:hypothetical protein